MSLAVSAFAAESPDAIKAIIQSRDQAIHLLDDWMRDPFIPRGPDGIYYLSCTRQDNLPDKPNIVVFLTDDQGQLDGSPYGGQGIDFLPTLLEAAGGTPPAQLDGRSFLPVLRSQTAQHRERVFTTHANDGRFNVYPARAELDAWMKTQGDQQPHFAAPRWLSDPGSFGPKAEIADPPQQGTKQKGAK